VSAGGRRRPRGSCWPRAAPRRRSRRRPSRRTAPRPRPPSGRAPPPSPRHRAGQGPPGGDVAIIVWLAEPLCPTGLSVRAGAPRTQVRPCPRRLSLGRVGGRRLREASGRLAVIVGVSAVWRITSAHGRECTSDDRRPPARTQPASVGQSRRLGSDLRPSGRSRQWLGAAPATSIQAAHRCSPRQAQVWSGCGRGTSAERLTRGSDPLGLPLGFSDGSGGLR
jgi:hypothetical protein